MITGVQEPYQVQAEDNRVYLETTYLTAERMAAYYYQYKQIRSLHAQQVLEIGIGNGLLSFLLKQTGLNVTTLDYDRRLNPDINALVTRIPCDDEAFDLAACFEVLEHLPYDQFQTAMGEIRRVVKRYVVLSLPDTRAFIKLHIPLLARKRLWELPMFFARQHRYDGQHYWELNKKGYALGKVCDDIRAVGFEVIQTQRFWEFPFNHMIVLEKTT